MINIWAIDWSKVTKNAPTTPNLPTRAPSSWVTSYMQRPPVTKPFFGALNTIRKPIVPQKQDDFVSADSFKLNKPLDEYQKGVFMQLAANILKGDDVATLKAKYPEIREIGDKSLEALGANVKRGDSPEYIYSKFPELQWIKNPQTENSSVSTPLQGGIKGAMSSFVKQDWLYWALNKANPIWLWFEQLDNLVQQIPTMSRDEMKTKLKWTPFEGMEVLPTMVVNALPSFLKTATATARGITNPLDTLVGLGKLIATPEWHAMLKQRYGSRENVGKTMTEDPVGMASDILTIVQWGAWISSKWAKIAWLENTANRLSNISHIAGWASNLWIGYNLPVPKPLQGITDTVSSTIDSSPILKGALKVVMAPVQPLKTLSDILSKAIGWADYIISTELPRGKRQEKFIQMTGKTPAQYLGDLGIKWVDAENVAKLNDVWELAKKQADLWFSEMKWKYKFTPIEYKKFDWTNISYKWDAILDMLEDIIDKKPKNTTEVDIFMKYLEDYKRWGLEQLDINAIKREFERSNKFNYLRENNIDRYNWATNVDSAVREWQYKVAESRGMDLKAVNKQTQAIKILIDKLWWPDVGWKGLSLTDWIVASNVTPASIALLVGKKFASSPYVKNAVVWLLNKIGWRKRQFTEVDIEDIKNIQTQVDLERFLLKIFWKDGIPASDPFGNSVNSTNRLGLPLKVETPTNVYKPPTDTITPSWKVIPSRFKKIIEMWEGKQPWTTKIDEWKQVVKLEWQENMPKVLKDAILPKKMPKQTKPQEKQAVIEGEKGVVKTDTTPLKQSFRWGVEKVKPNNQLKFNQGDSYEAVRLVVNDKDAMVARYWALNNKNNMKFQGKWSGITDTQKTEMKQIEKQLDMLPWDIIKRHQFLKDEAKKARSANEEVVIEIKDDFWVKKADTP